MKAIILAAGRGSRMKELTDDIPKCLVKYNGRTLLDWQLAAIREAGINEIAIVTGYKRELINSKGNIEFFNPRWADTNMVSSLACAQEWLKEGPCIVSYSDLYYEAEGIKALMECQQDLAITFDINWKSLWEKRFGDPLLDAETFRIDNNNFLEEIGNKPQTVEEIQGQYMGLLRFTPKSWMEVERIRSTLDQSMKDKIHMTGTLQKIIEAGNLKVKAVPYRGKWAEFDSISDLANTI